MTDQSRRLRLPPLDRRPHVAISYWRDGRNPVKTRLLDRVQRWADLTVLDPETDHPHLDTMGIDLFHAAGWQPAALADLKRAVGAGIPTINSYEGAQLTADRVACNRARLAGGLKTPRFQFGTAEEITLKPPVLIKPRYELGPGSHDFEVAYTRDYEFEGSKFVQEYIVPRRSYKVYGVGSVRRAVRLAGHEDVPVETALPRKFGDLADRVSELYGLSLFEMDVVTHKALYVIDVNPVVSLLGVEDGAAIYDRLLRTSATRAFL